MQRRTVLKLSAALLGSAAGGGLARAVLAGVDAASSAGALAHFGEGRGAAVRLLAEMIIPETDTPGAAAAGVPDFIGAIVFDWYRPAERAAFMRGLDALDAFCREREGKPFHLATEAGRTAALQEQEQLALAYREAQLSREKESGKPSGERASNGQDSGGPSSEPAPAGTFPELHPTTDDEPGPFFNRLRELVVYGYYTSEVGATEELAYRPVPGHYHGDFEFSEIGRQLAY